MLRSDLCDYKDAYTVVKGVVTVSTEEKDRDEMDRDFVLKNNTPIISCISKINGALIENAENLDIVMPTYNLLNYSKNDSKTSGSLWNYYREELTDEANENNGPNKNVINSKSFKYKTSITGYVEICRKMETQKIVTLLKESENESSKFPTKKWYIINDQNNGQYSE